MSHFQVHWWKAGNFWFSVQVFWQGPEFDQNVDLWHLAASTRAFFNVLSSVYFRHFCIDVKLGLNTIGLSGIYPCYTKMGHFECYIGTASSFKELGVVQQGCLVRQLIANVTISILFWPSFLFCNKTTGVLTSESTFRSSKLQIQLKSRKRKLRFLPL